MGFCGKDPPIEDVFVSYKLEKKKKENKLLFFPPTPAPEIKDEAAATSLLLSYPPCGARENG